MKNVYVGHPNSINFLDELYPAVEESLIHQKCRVAYPHKDGKKEPFPSKEYLQNCSLMIAEGSEAATGLGIEMGWADMLGVPILCIYKKGSKVSGSYHVVTNWFMEYENKKDLIEKLNRYYHEHLDV